MLRLSYGDVFFARIEADRTLACPEVSYLVNFIRTSKRGVTLRRPRRRIDPGWIDD